MWGFNWPYFPLDQNLYTLIAVWLLHKSLNSHPSSTWQHFHQMQPITSLKSIRCRWCCMLGEHHPVILSGQSLLCNTLMCWAGGNIKMDHLAECVVQSVSGHGSFIPLPSAKDKAQSCSVSVGRVGYRVAHLASLNITFPTDGLDQEANLAGFDSNAFIVSQSTKIYTGDICSRQESFYMFLGGCMLEGWNAHCLCIGSSTMEDAIKRNEKSNNW